MCALTCVVASNELTQSPDFVNAYPKIHQRIEERCVDDVS